MRLPAQWPPLLVPSGTEAAPCLLMKPTDSRLTYLSVSSIIISFQVISLVMLQQKLCALCRYIVVCLANYHHAHVRRMSIHKAGRQLTARCCIRQQSTSELITTMRDLMERMCVLQNCVCGSAPSWGRKITCPMLISPVCVQCTYASLHGKRLNMLLMVIWQL